ncbi:MAG TPA: MFS transporter [Devosia sp.]|nr:MFS transporter [Devosia sp.]
MSLPLIALFIAAFAFGTTEFVIAGVLPQVATGLGVTIPVAGYLVSGYAIGIAFGGPLLTFATTGLQRRTLMLGLIAVFTIGQVACALAPDFAAMLLLRIAIAVVHGTFFGIAMVVAVGLVAPERRGFAVALILSGLTVSNVVGVPLGAAIGNVWGWRATFWAMSGLGLLASAAVLFWMPRTKGTAAPRPAFRSEIGVLGRQQAWTSLFLMLMLMIGQYVPFTYIAPMLQEVTGLDEGMIPWVLLLNGVGSTVGVFLGGRLADWKLMPSLITMLLLQAIVLVILYLASPYPLPMVVTVFFWGALNFAIGTPIQTRILSWTADAPGLASSLIPSGFNIGIALAASLGGAMLNAGLGYRSLPLAGTIALCIAALVAVISLIWENRRGLPPPMSATSPAQ